MILCLVDIANMTRSRRLYLNLEKISVGVSVCLLVILPCDGFWGKCGLFTFGGSYVRGSMISCDLSET